MEMIDFDIVDEKIIKAIPKKGTFDISDLSGRTLYTPSRVNKTVKKLVSKGYLVKRSAGEKKEQCKGLSGRIEGRIIRVPEGSAQKSMNEVYILSDTGGKIKLMIDRLADSSSNEQ